MYERCSTHGKAKHVGHDIVDDDHHNGYDEPDKPLKHVLDDQVALGDHTEQGHMGPGKEGELQEMNPVRIKKNKADEGNDLNVSSPGGGSTSSRGKERTRRSPGYRERRRSTGGSEPGMGENPPGKGLKMPLVWLDTNPVDDNTKLFHQSFSVEKVVGGDKEIPEWFLSGRKNVHI